jgi:hypothetical protein
MTLCKCFTCLGDPAGIKIASPWNWVIT